MIDNLQHLIETVRAHLRILGLRSPGTAVLKKLLRITYLASLRTEEGRFVRGSVTFANPANPDINPPICRRADYPKFTSFAEPLPLTPQTLVKLFRAVDRWSGSITTYGTGTSPLVAWGVLDQLVGQNIRRHHESSSGFSAPGIITVGVDGVGELSVYHGNLFLGGVREDALVKRRNDALWSVSVGQRVIPYLSPIAARIAREDSVQSDRNDLICSLFNVWATAIARLCIGLRRMGTGGSFLISPDPRDDSLEIAYSFPYHRLCSAAILQVLDTEHLCTVSDNVMRSTSQAIDRDSLYERDFAEADAEDRAKELTGAVKLVTSLAAVDGLVLLEPLLKVIGFGVKIKSRARIGKVYDGAALVRRKASNRTIDPARFGTRHGSMLRYCRSDPRAIGIVVSQDGHVRMILTANRRLTLWDDVNLLRHDDDVQSHATWLRWNRKYRQQHRHENHLGYTSTPKTLDDLLGP